MRAAVGVALRRFDGFSVGSRNIGIWVFGIFCGEDLGGRSSKGFEEFLQRKPFFKLQSIAGFDRGFLKGLNCPG